MPSRSSRGPGGRPGGAEPPHRARGGVPRERPGAPAGPGEPDDLRYRPARRLRLAGDDARARRPHRDRHPSGRRAAPAGRRGRSRDPRRGDPPEPGGLGRRGSLTAAQEHSLDPATSALRLASRTDDLGTEAAYLVLEAAQRLEAAGRHVVHLEIGEPDTPTPPHIVEAGGGGRRGGHTRYALAPRLPGPRAPRAGAPGAPG